MLSIRSLQSRPVTSPARWRVKNPVPHATSSVFLRPEAGKDVLEPHDLGTEALTLLALVVDAAVPVVVLGGTPVVVLLHRS